MAFPQVVNQHEVHACFEGGLPSQERGVHLQVLAMCVYVISGVIRADFAHQPDGLAK